MVTHVKPHAFGSRRLRDQEDTIFWLRPKIFCGVGFLGPLALDDVLMDIPRNNVLGVSDDGNPFKVSSTTLVMFPFKVSSTTLATRASASVLEPQSVNDRLDPQCGEAQC
jgi:hypothetical protein